MSEVQDTTKQHNRKRKKNFLKNARKYAKRGYYGRGTQMEADQYQYFVKIMEAYNNGFDNDEDKAIFVNNVFEQTENTEVDCCCNQVGCRVIETLLPFANDDVLRRFMEIFASDLRPLSKDRFASHVLEALVTVANRKSLDNGLDNELRNHNKEFLLKVSKFLLNNLEDYMWDTYGNHVIRTCLENLVQLPKSDPKQKNTQKTNSVKVETEIPNEYVGIVKEYGQRLISWPQFNELCNSELTSGFLQILLKALKIADTKLLNTYLDKLLKENFTNKNEQESANLNSIPQAFLSKSLTMLLETALEVAPAKRFSKIYVRCFANTLRKLAVTRNTNFAVQKLLTCCNEKTEFESIFDELADHFKEIVLAGHSGVILNLAQACKRLSAKQGSFMQSAMKCFDCFEPEERQNLFVLCLSRFTSYENTISQSNTNLQKEKLNLHGTLILQLLLEFNKPIKVVNALLSMETNDLKNLFANSMGSHIVDSYVKSVFVGEKSREKLLKKMKGSFQDLASTKYGSRAFEALWNAGNLKTKLQIMEELSYKDGSWSNTEHGKIISAKVNLALFKRNKEDWKNCLNKVNKAEDLFADVLK